MHPIIKASYLIAVTTLLTLPWSAQADLEKAYQAYHSGDFETAIAIWQPLAQAGDAVAQFNLGQMYRLGEGVSQNYREAIRWYTLAAKQGSPQARHNVRLMHRDGHASQEDYEAVFGPLKKPASATKPAAAPKVQAVAAKPTVSKPVSPPKIDWLEQLNPDYYLVQLMAAPEKQSLQKFIAANKDSIPAQAKTLLTHSRGRDWFVLLIGPFTDSAQAKTAIKKLPLALQEHKPWPRSVASVKRAVR